MLDAAAEEARASGTLPGASPAPSGITDLQWATFQTQLEPLLVDVCVAAGKRAGALAPQLDLGALATSVVAGILARFQADAGPLAPLTTGLDHVFAELSRLTKRLEELPGLSTDGLVTLGQVLDRHFSTLPGRLTDIESSIQQLTATVNVLQDR